jgi:uncharacterized Zn-binding protein involved in type VI secretion
MPPQCRVSDMSQAPACPHGCLACPHPSSVGPAIAGSPDVMVNKLPALRVDDTGIHGVCCTTNTWTAKTGSSTVFINNKAAHRLGDQDQHCSANPGQMINGSPNVITGD